MRLTTLAFALLLSAPVFIACGDDPTTPATDTTTDTGTDEGGDAVEGDADETDTTEPDTTEDTGPDALEDTGPDAVEDTGPDTAEPDTTEDTGPDAVEDVDETDVTDAIEGDADETDTIDDADEGDADEGDAGPDVIEPTCDYNGFSAVAQDALDLDDGDIGYLAQSTLDSPVDVLFIEIYASVGGAAEAGEYQLTGENYDSCGNCILLDMQCDEPFGDCEKTFLVQSGTLVIDELGVSGDFFRGTLTNAVLVEVTFDGWTSTVVEGGETWCVDSFAFDTIIQ